MLLFVAIPVGIALFLPPQQMFQALFMFSIVGMGLLWFTGGFDWRALLHGWGRFDWRLFLAFGLLTFTCSVVVLYLTRPDALFGFIRRDPRFLIVIWALYPLLSALPQELIFRVLFFHRYGWLFSGPRQAVLANAALFSLAHLMYWSWIVAVFTFFGGLIFASGYLRRGFPWAWALHAVAGNILFAVGMGVYFYSGNAVRPF
ncbi:CAAX protease self-immunity [Paracoccus isoporae]|uniref:CAAX protease self-immunity n=1 Tax=Paracoccus isoporae TaxID=591205 RepID=A0A1G6STE8_9RHOB|nr:CPBP family intramembrane glutamic endopeptidase [Paracoccus isoporae]SDD20210.1 CAAX protease self-immunity [Paracoccus isoporae]